MTDQENPVPKVIPTKNIVVALIFVLLSMIDNITIGNLKFSGRVSVLALAALIIVWPLLRQLGNRGGTAEFLGIKLQINNLEKKSESEYGVKIEELRVDLEGLRSELKSNPINTKPVSTTPSPIDEQIFLEAISIYNTHNHVSDWRPRIEADKKLATVTIPVLYLRNALKESPNNQGIAMAVAVALGTRIQSDAIDSAELLVELLDNSFERARYRAAKSVERRFKRADITEQEQNILIVGVTQRYRTEPVQVVREALDEAQKAIKILRHHT